MGDQNPRNTSTRTSLEAVTRKVVNDAAAELAAYLNKLPESGGPAPSPDSSASVTREQVLEARRAIDRYLGHGAP